MRENKLRRLLKEGKPTIGTHIHSTWPGIIEVIGHTGVVDYVEFTAEYAPFSLYDFDNMARAAELFDMSLMIKVDRSLQTFLAQRAFGAGFQNVLFTDCRSVEDVQDCVRSIRAETPSTKGIMGCAMRRDVGYLLECGSEAYVQALEDSVIAVMIEKQGAVDNLEDILSVKGLDMVQFGPCDYSMSTGIPGQWSNKEVWETQKRVIKSAQRKGVTPRAEIGSAKDAKMFLDLGVKDFCIGADLVILYQWIKEEGSMLRGLLK